EEMGRPGGDHRRGLDPAGARPDEPDALAREAHAFARPPRRVVDLAPEALETPDPGAVRRREAPHGADQEARRHALPPRAPDLPELRGVVEAGARDPRPEPDVAAQVEAVGHVVQVALDLRLLGVPAGPLPLLRELLGEREAVVEALGVA